MRVVCRTVVDFLANLIAVPSDQVFQRIVYTSRSRQPIDGDNRSAAKFSVNFQVSTVIVLEDGGEYLLEAGEDCGVDYADSTQDYSGSERADELRGLIEKHCGSCGLCVRPGIVDF